jgi:hypothetical protein
MLQHAKDGVDKGISFNINNPTGPTGPLCPKILLMSRKPA